MQTGILFGDAMSGAPASKFRIPRLKTAATKPYDFIIKPIVAAVFNRGLINRILMHCPRYVSALCHSGADAINRVPMLFA